MLIVSQEGDTIVNFNNVSYLWINECDKGYELRLDTTYHSLSLGEYLSYARVMAILDDIQRKYMDCNSFGSGFVKNYIYYLPEE